MKCSWCGKEAGDKATVCAKCQKNRIAEHLENAKLAKREYAFAKVIAECDEVLKLDSSNLEATNLKEEVSDFSNMIEENRKLSEEAFKNNDFEKALFYLDKILQLNPTDEEASRRKEMTRVLVNVDADRFQLKSKEESEADKKTLPKKKNKYTPILTFT